jgi:CHAD domain-containing protein
MNTKIFYSSIIALSKKLLKYSSHTGDEFDQEIIHSLRTSFKKLRALLRWQQVDKKILVSFKKIYAAAGQLRNIQVVQEILPEEHTTGIFTNWLSARLVKSQDEWNKVYERKTGIQFFEKLEKVKLNPRTHRSFFSKKIKEINKILSIDPVPDVLLHEVRKLCKDMQYVLEYVAKKENFPGSRLIHMPVKKLITITRKIGEYNDKRMLVSLLTACASQLKEPDLKREIRTILDKQRQEKELQKKKLLSLLTHSFNKFF